MDLVNLDELVSQIVLVQVLLHDDIGLVFDAEYMIHQLVELKVFGIRDQGHKLGEIFVTESFKKFLHSGSVRGFQADARLDLLLEFGIVLDLVEIFGKAVIFGDLIQDLIPLHVGVELVEHL